MREGALKAPGGQLDCDRTVPTLKKMEAGVPLKMDGMGLVTFG